MKIQLTEEMIRNRATEQSFEKGMDYYKSGAIYTPTWQSGPDGYILLAHCEGSDDAAYRLTVRLDSSGIRIASCTCPYDWGGDCKHIVALLLTYLHQPKSFTEQKSVTEMLSGLDKEVLAAIIVRLVERDPDLYDDLEIIIPSVTATVQPKSPTFNEKHQTPISEPTYRKQIKRILKQNRYSDDYEAYGSAPAYLDDLEEMLQNAQQLLDTGDAEGALIILRVLLEETVNEYDSELDYEGDVALFIQNLGNPIAEAILSTELDETSYQTLYTTMEKIFKKLDDSIEASELQVIFAALDYEWKDLPDKETEWDKHDEETWMLYDQLQQARLNVLDRQGRTDEFLRLAQKADTHRYVLKLLQLERLDDAIAASQKLVYEREIHSVAQRLYDAGRQKEAIAMAERAVQKPGPHSLELAAWLAPLEEARGQTDLALLAYRTAFDIQSSITWYRHLKRVSGKNWERLRPELMRSVTERADPYNLVDFYLEEQDWDAAIATAEKQSWSYNPLEKVADALINHRPDWVIRVSLKQAEQLIATVQSNNYPTAAKWLLRAKKAYQRKGQLTDWQIYIDDLRVRYPRRPSLQNAIRSL